MTYPGQEPATPREEITTPTLVGAAAEAIGRIVGDVRQALAAVATLAAPSTTQTPEPAQVGSRTTGPLRPSQRRSWTRQTTALTWSRPRPESSHERTSRGAGHVPGR
jgi:hypothetical protein